MVDQVPLERPTSDISSGSLFALQKVEEEEAVLLVEQQQQFLLLLIIILVVVVVKLLFRRGERIAEKEVSKSDHIPPSKPIRVRTYTIHTHRIPCMQRQEADKMSAACARRASFFPIMSIHQKNRISLHYPSFVCPLPLHVTTRCSSQALNQGTPKKYVL